MSQNLLIHNAISGRDTTLHQPANGLPRIPIEVCERIFDWIVFQLRHLSTNEADREMLERLSICSLVCRAWRIHTQALLFTKVTLSYEGLSSLDRVLKDNPAMFPSVKKMIIIRKSKTKSISFFAIRRRLPNLAHLQMDELDLSREHQWLHRAPLFRSVRRLRLYGLQLCQLSQLVRFINCFPFLTDLDLVFAFNRLEHRGLILPQPSCLETRSLTWLELDLKPGVSALIDWFLNAKPLLAQLKTLALYAWNIESVAAFISSFEGVDKLLDSCRKSIEDLRLRLESVPMTESVSDIVRLDSFPNLKYLTYGSPDKDSVLPYAARQLRAIASTKWNLAKIIFDIKVDTVEGQLNAGICECLDGLLCGENFPSLKNVDVHRTIPFLLFPRLSEAGLLGIVSNSFWKDGERLPFDLCKRIIDWVNHEQATSRWKWDWEIRRTLITCSLVCWKWQDYSQRYLVQPMEVSYEELPFFSGALYRDCLLSLKITRLSITRTSRTQTISTTITQHYLPNLKYISIHGLDLSREQKSLYRAPLFYPVQMLQLYNLRPCNLSQLILFINSFPSLSGLSLNFASKTLEYQYRERIFPDVSHNEIQPLTRLELDLKPGVSALIYWLLNARGVLTQLKTLALSVTGCNDWAGLRSSFEMVECLLGRCCSSIDHLALSFSYVPMVSDISDLVQLSLLHNITFLTYGSNGKAFILPYAVRQLQAIASTSGLVQVALDIRLNKNERQLNRALCEDLDRVLCGGQFPSLKAVLLHRTISFFFFPRLKSAGLLQVLSYSQWVDMPVRSSCPRLPIKLCLIIIDWVYHQRTSSSWEARQTLRACSLVCRVWRAHVMPYLSKPVEVSYEELLSFGDALRRDPWIGSGIAGLEITKKSKTVPVSPFMIYHQLPNLTDLYMCELDLSLEHRWLYGASFFHPVRRLILHHLLSFQLYELVLFINSFPSLSELSLNFASKGLKHQGQILPKPSHINTRSLTWLELDLKPGVSVLIDWFLKAGPLLERLKALTFHLWFIQCEDGLLSSFEGVNRLLDCCRMQVEDIGLHLDNVIKAERIFGLVQLGSFPNLKSVTYGSSITDLIIPTAILQLTAITFACHLTNIIFDLSFDHRHQPDPELCRILDNLLTGDRFPLLQVVSLHRTISPELFPGLRRTGRLRCLKDSFWVDPPIGGED